MSSLNRTHQLAFRDPADAAERLAGFHEAVRFAEHELGEAITVARMAGMTWDEVGAALGMTKQGASQLHKRMVAHDRHIEAMSSYRIDQLAKLLGARMAPVRWEVRVIVSGKPGRTKVVRQTLSRHIDRAVAEDRCDKREGAELWKVRPDGSEQREPVRPVAARRPNLAEHDDDF